ncbi:hypothetical protein [Spirosoma validum]|uniref:Uncharacterized protein n=1 Tax=Spirosoma validum TaxID=2771355 RepID=A0A927B1U9_9BACT|nr:hypothetical protein [Spirosoma validum]MBD2753722.1 hypothetical protein [Spirosoma validum]
MTTDAIETQEEVHNAIVVSGPSQTPIAFDITVSAIAQMHNHALDLTIAGPDDKEGYKQVYDYRQVVKRQRVAVEKRQKELKATHIQYNREVDAAAKQLTEPMDQIEDGLAKKEKAYTDERDRIAHERAMAERQRLEGRVNQLRAFGFEWNAGAETYDFIRDEYALNLRINFEDVKALSDEEFAPSLLLAETTYQAVEKILADKRESDRKEAERLADEQETERKRLAAENQRLAEEKAELQRKADALDALTLKNRATALINVGFVFDSGVYNNPDQNSYWRPAKLLKLTDEEFDQLVEQTSVANTKREEDRVAAEEAEKLRIKNEKQAILAKQKADKVRTERLRPEKKILAKFLKEHGTPKVPATSEPESAEFLYNYCVRLKELTTEFSAMLEVL